VRRYARGCYGFDNLLHGGSGNPCGNDAKVSPCELGRNYIVRRLFMRFSRIVFLSFLIAPIGIGLSTGLPPQPMAAPAQVALPAIDDYVAQSVRAKEVVGLSLAIVRDGKIVLVQGYGKSCLEPARLVDTGTRFGIGSVTKQFACAAILKLADDG